MKIFSKFIFLLGVGFGLQSNIDAQENSYQYQEAFRPLFYQNNATETRSASGQPGHNYWQNYADYVLNVELDEEKNQLKGTATITYTNNSFDDLAFLWLQLDQNLFNKESRGHALIPTSGSRYGSTKNPFEGGYTIQEVKINGQKSQYSIRDTRMKIDLPNALKARGGKVTIEIAYQFVSPQYGADRMGVEPTKNGKIFAMAQWFPRMSVYDDILGWNTLPYLGAGEFYLSYGTVTANITVPASHYVVASGELLNPKEVYTKQELQRIEQAKNSDQTVFIRTAKEVAEAQKVSHQTKTWKFKIENTRDFAFASSTAFILDAARINLPSGKKAMALSAYPVESEGGNAWGRSTEYTKASVEYYSKKWYEYPYAVATNVASNVGGMEYPGIVFCHMKAANKSLWGVTDHEFGHILFPMIVGSNERIHGWMDEGFNTFINSLSTKNFNKGEYAPTKNNIQQMGDIYFSKNLEPIMTAPDNMKEGNIALLLYYKPAAGLTLLREVILGEEVFDKAFRTYIERWAYKHPTPEDFFRTMENVSGEELNWFWRGWFYENWAIDQAVKNVVYQDNSYQNGAKITVENIGQLPMPTTIQITYEDQKTETIQLPIEVWKRNTEWTFYVPSTKKISEVRLDPQGKIPDMNLNNNVWKMK